MLLADYQNKLIKIDIDCKHEKIKAAQEYCLANNTVKVGDIFTDHIGSIVVEKISYSISDKPCCVYIGAELTKKLEPKKSGSKRSAWQCNQLKETK